MKKHRRKRVRITHIVDVTDRPVEGKAWYLAGRLLFVEEKNWEDDTATDWIKYRVVQPDGTLGRTCELGWR